MNRLLTFLSLYIFALALLAIGFRGTWLFIFIWLPPALCLWTLLRMRGLFACLFNPFAILNLAYVYMLFDYISYSLLCLIHFSVPSAPISPSFFIALLLGSAFCSLGGAACRPLMTNKLLAAASCFESNSLRDSGMHWRDLLARRLFVLPFVVISVFLLRPLSASAFGIPSVQIVSFVYLLVISLYCPRQVNITLILFFIFDYLCFFAFLNSSTLAFGNRTSVLQPLLLVSVAFAISLSAGAFARCQGNWQVPSYMKMRPSFPAVSRAPLMISKRTLLILLALLCGFAFLIVSTITKFSDSQNLSIVDALAYYFSPFIAYDGLVLRAATADSLASSSVPGKYTFYQLAQLFTSFAPSALLPDKPEYDISVIFFKNGVYPAPLYFEPFLNQYADMGIVGPVFYAAFLYSFHGLYLLFVKPRSGLSLRLWISLQPLFVLGTIFFMQTPWHFARYCLFVIALILPLTISFKLMKLLIPYGSTTRHFR